MIDYDTVIGVLIALLCLLLVVRCNMSSIYHYKQEIPSHLQIEQHNELDPLNDLS